MRICHVITRMIVGGAQENTLLTVRGLMERGHEVVLATGPSLGPEGRLLERCAVPGMQLVTLPHLVRELHPWHDLLAYRALVRLFREGGYDVVHTHSSKAGILGRLAARRARVPVVVHTVHGQAFHPYQAWWKNRLYIAAERVAARASDCIVTVAQAMIEQCVAARVAPRARYRVIYSGMEIETFLEARRDATVRAALGIPADALVVGTIARLFELKGHDCLLAAAPAVVAAFPNVRFLLVGDGVLRHALEADAKNRSVAANVVFAGLVAPERIPAITAQMDVLVHLSLREGLPRAVVQALACGIPAVGFPLDGTPEVIHDGETGLLCPPGDAAAVAEAIITLLRDPALRRRLGARGRELVRERFSWQYMTAELEALYNEALAGRNARLGDG